MEETIKKIIQPLILLQLHGLIFNIQPYISQIIGLFDMHPLVQMENTLPLLVNEDLRTTMLFQIDGNCLEINSRNKASW
jgi:hypothetical protein